MSREKVIRSEKKLQEFRDEAKGLPRLISALIETANQKYSEGHTLYSVAIGIGINRQSIYAMNAKNSFPVFMLLPLKEHLGLSWEDVIGVVESIFTLGHLDKDEG